jgi:aspartate aminotransferase
MINSSDDFAAALLEKAKVALVPGEGFMAPGYLRWSYATSIENIKKGLDRLEKFLNNEF